MSKKIFLFIIIFIAAFILLVLCNAQDAQEIIVKQILTPEYTKVDIQGDESRQLAGEIVISSGDLSLAYANGIGWMAYSGAENDKTFKKGYVSNHIAKTEDNGETWRYVQLINLSFEEVLRPTNKALIDFRGEILEGSWFNEVPTLVHTPDDPGREWKLFWHKYFMLHGKGEAGRVLMYSWIAYKYASSPDGVWSDEIPLFGAGSSPVKPYSAKINLNALHPDLRKNVVYTEPGSLYWDGVLYLSLQAIKIVRKGVIETDIILIASRDLGKTWRYVGTLLKHDLIKQFNLRAFTATELAQQEGKPYFLISMEKEVEKFVIDQHHFGTLVFEFEDIRRGKLKKENGKLVANKWLQIDTTGGQADYEEEIKGGIYTHKFNFKDFPGGKIVTIRKTHIDLK
jgi:hypothetical protein